MESLRKDQFGREQQASLQGSNKQFALYDGLNTVGRNKEAIVNIKSLSISQHHAIIISQNDTNYVSDLNSCNGTILNGMKLKPFLMYELTNEAELTFGDYVAYFSTEIIPQSFENDMTQNLTQTFYNGDTQVLDTSNINIRDSFSKTTRTFDIHDAPTQVVDISELEISRKSNKNHIYKVSEKLTQQRVNQEDIHNALTQVVNLEEFEFSSASTSTHKKTEDDIHEAATQVVSVLRKGSQTADVETIGNLNAGKSKDKTFEDTKEKLNLEKQDIGSESSIYDAVTQIVPTEEELNLEKQDTGPVLSIYDAATQIVPIDEHDEPSNSKRRLDGESNVCKVATQVADFSIDSDIYEEVHILPTVDKSLDIHELETQVVHISGKQPSEEEKVGDGVNEADLGEGKGELDLIPEVTENKGHDIFKNVNENLEASSSSVETRTSTDSEVRFISKNISTATVELLNDSSNDSVDFLTFDKNSSRVCNIKDNTTKPSVRNSDDETDTENQNTPSKKGAATLDDSDTDIEVEEKCSLTEMRTDKELHSTNLDLGPNQKPRSTSKLEHKNKETNITADSDESSQLVIKSRKKSRNVIESSDSETDIEEEIKIKRKPVRMLLTQESDTGDLNSDSDDDVVRVKRKSVNILGTPTDEGSDKENFSKNSDARNDTTIAESPLQLNNSANLDDTDCIPATQEFNTPRDALHKKNWKVFDSVQRCEKYSTTDNLDDTDCISGTQALKEPSNLLSNTKTNSDEKADKVNEAGMNKMVSDDDDDDIGSSFNLQLTGRSESYLPTQKLTESLDLKDANENEDPYIQHMQKVFHCTSKLNEAYESDGDDHLFLQPTQRISSKSPTFTGKRSKNLIDTADEDIYLQPTQELASDLPSTSGLNKGKDSKNHNDTADEGIYFQPTQKLSSALPSSSRFNKSQNTDDIYLQSTQKLPLDSDDKNEDNEKQLTQKCTSDVLTGPSGLDKGKGRKDKADGVYFQATQKLDLALANTSGLNKSQNTDDIYLQPTQKVPLDTDDKDEDNEEQPTQKFTSDLPNTSGLNKGKSIKDTAAEGIYFQATQKLDLALPNTSGVNKTQNTDDIYLQPTQKLSLDIDNNNEENKHQAKEVRKDNILGTTTQSDIPGPKAKVSGKKKFIFKKSTVSLNTSLSETLPSIVPDGTGLATEKADDETKIEPVETLSQIAAFVNESNIESVDIIETKQFKSNKSNTKASIGVIKTVKHIVEENMFDLPTQELPKVKEKSTADTVETMSQIEAFVNSSCITEAKTPRGRKPKPVLQKGIKETPDQQDTVRSSRNRKLKTPQEGSEDLPNKLNKKGSILDQNKISEEQNDENSSSSCKPKLTQKSSEDEISRKIIKNDIATEIPAKRAKRDRSENRETSRKNESTMDNELVKPSSVTCNKAVKGKQVEYQPPNTKYAKYDTSLLTINEERVQISATVYTISSIEQKIPVRSIKKADLAAQISEESKQIQSSLKKSEARKTPARTTRRKRSASLISEDNDVAGEVQTIVHENIIKYNPEESSVSVNKDKNQKLAAKVGRGRRISSSSESNSSLKPASKVNGSLISDNESKLEVNQSFALLEAKSTRTRKTKKSQDDIQVKVPKLVKTRKGLKDTAVPASTSQISNRTSDKSEDELSYASSSTSSTPKKQRLTANSTFTSPSERSKRKQRPKVVFTMLENPQLESMIRQLGGSIADSVDTCTVLVTQAVKRSQKLLQAVGQSKPICSSKWIQESKKAHKFLDPWDYILFDKEAEDKWKFSLKESLNRSSSKRLLQDYTFQLIVTQAVDVLKGAIEACGGKCVSRNPGRDAVNFFVVSTPEHKTKFSKIIKQHPNVKVILPEAIFDGVLRQDLKFEDHYVR